MRKNALTGKQPLMSRMIRPERVMALGFLAMILLGTALLSLPVATVERRSAGVLNALFTATSAVCVTGLAVLDTGTVFSVFGKVVIIALIQIGGLGFMVFATLIMVALGRRISLRNRVLIRESMNATSLSGLVRLSIWFFGLALVIELLGACILGIRFIPMYGVGKGILYSLFHSVSAFCNAGFDLFGDFQSLAGFQRDPLVLLTLTALIVLGGLGFSVITECLHFSRARTRLSLHTKLVLVTSAILLVSGTALIALLEWDNPATLAGGDLNNGDKLLNALFQSVTLRTAGFASFDQANLRDSSKLLGLLYMFVGGSPASTSGGVKTTTLATLALVVISSIHGRREVNVFGKRLDIGTIRRALVIASIGAVAVLLGGVLLAVLERDSGIPLIDLIYETVSAFATVGLSSAGTPNLSAASRIVLLPMMFLGRVGPLTLAYALAAREGDDSANHVRYPEEKIMIG